MESAYLDSLNISEDRRQMIEGCLGRVQLRNAKSIRMRIENGHDLNVIRSNIPHGGWMAWMLGEAQSGYHSDRTIERDIALAEALYDSLDQLTDEMLARQTNLTALRALAQDDSGDLLHMAIRLLQQGITVKPEDAAALAEIRYADLRLGDAVVEGRLTLQDARLVAERINALQPAAAVRELVITSAVRSPEVVESLTALYVNDRSAFDEIAASGAIYNAVTETQIPLAQASGGDAGVAAAVEASEALARHITHINNWKAGQPDRVADVRGRRMAVLMELALAIPDDDREYHVIAYPVAVEQPAPEPERA